jgi:hypothetical protein
VTERAKGIEGITSPVAKFLNAEIVEAILERTGAGHDALPFRLQRQQRVGGDGFDLGYHEIRFFFGDQGTQGVAVEHINDVRAMGKVHGGGIGVAIDRNDFNPKTLALNGDLFTQL